MTLDQAKAKLTSEQLSELESKGRAWGEQEVELWRDQNPDRDMPEWTMGTYSGSLYATADEEILDAAELVLDCAARDAWNAAAWNHAARNAQ